MKSTIRHTQMLKTNNRYDLHFNNHLLQEV